jgi:2-polyprenyl-6-hydroxyphenyl methylase/3-demethylubiquinone-9 3-methyltransferase
MNDQTTADPALPDVAARNAIEVDRGDRFEFGDNWRRFLDVLDERRIAEAERSLRSMFGETDLRGKTFLDVGSGSGLFSLAAMRLGAARVRSFDFDEASVACTREVKRRFMPDADAWTIGPGDVLDEAFLSSLGTWDVVYSWGVLHHTGAMLDAFEHVARLVAPGGTLFISIYNDQGPRSRLWRMVKRGYNRVPARLRTAYAIIVMAPRELLSFGYATARLKPWRYVQTWTSYHRSRGMSRWHDLVDWVGGYPFEVAKPEEVFAFFRARGFRLERLTTCGGGLGCNEFVFVRE